MSLDRYFDELVGLLAGWLSGRLVGWMVRVDLSIHSSNLFMKLELSTTHLRPPSGLCYLSASIVYVACWSIHLHNCPTCAVSVWLRKISCVLNLISRFTYFIT